MAIERRRLATICNNERVMRRSQKKTKKTKKQNHGYLNNNQRKASITKHQRKTSIIHKSYLDDNDVNGEVVIGSVVRLPNIIVTEPRRISAVSGLIMAYLMLQCYSALDVAGIETSESSAQLL